jgi:effector-binding domain-containing protein
MSYKCEIYQQTAQPTLSIRTQVSVEKLPQVLGESYGAIGQYLASLGEAPGGAPFVAYYNMSMEDLDIEAGFPVLKTLPGSGAIQSSQMPAGKFATCLYTGPYQECGSAYETLTHWIQEQGYEPTGVAYEFYLNNPAETPPEELKTQIIFQLKTT